MVKRSSKKSMSDLLNEQLGSSGGFDRHHDDEDLLAPALDELDEDFDHENDEPVLKSRRTEGNKKATTKKGNLRARGPLDSSLSTGDYAAEAITMREANANVDDIFGFLDETDADLGAGENISDEEEYEKWLEEQQKEKRKRKRPIATSTAASSSSVPTAGATEEEDDILRQLEELRERQMNVLSQPDELDEAAEEKRASTAEQLKALLEAYASLLRVRVKLQPVVLSCVQVPQYYSMSRFQKFEPAVTSKMNLIHEEVLQVYRDLITAAKILHPEEHSFGSSSHVAEAKLKKSKAGKSSLSAYAPLAKLHSSIMTKANSVIEAWSAKVVQPNAAKMKVVNQPLVDQIKSIIASKVRLLGKVQRNRSHIRIFGHPGHVKVQSAADRAVEIAAGDFDEEIFDDGEFVRELVHRSGSAAAKLESMVRDDEKRIAASMGSDIAALNAKGASKIGFHRKTKGKIVNYEPRPKLVGFMVRAPYQSLGEQQVAMFSSLFQ